MRKRGRVHKAKTGADRIAEVKKVKKREGKTGQEEGETGQEEMRG